MATIGPGAVTIAGARSITRDRVGGDGTCFAVIGANGPTTTNGNRRGELQGGKIGAALSVVGLSRRRGPMQGIVATLAGSGPTGSA